VKVVGFYASSCSLQWNRQLKRIASKNESSDAPTKSLSNEAI
jgi:hypothetical protein